ncbi:casein kinase 1 [Penicillium sp. IBT 18751x]|nr:casein kinase 1 [Penicillium sp. IBT 18751x]KAJ6117838.1 casein kinase 1 [Penicillium sp. IBT 18751x]
MFKQPSVAMIAYRGRNARPEPGYSPAQEAERRPSADENLKRNRCARERNASMIQRHGWLSGPQGGMLHHEYEVFQELRDSGGARKLHGFRRECHRNGRQYRRYVKMERLGPSLHNAMNHRLAKPRLARGLFFPLEEVVSIGKRLISALRHFHKQGFVHQNVQPRSIVCDSSQKRVLLIDYGAARSFHGDTQKYSVAQTAKQSSRNSAGAVRSPVTFNPDSHRDDTLSRHDDLESLGYVLVYLLHGQLPWQHLFPKAGSDIFARRSSISIEDYFDKLEPFDDYFRLLKTISFDQTPNYTGLQVALESLIL